MDDANREGILDRHWKIEKESFLATPRHPRWKEELITQAHDGLVGALNILCGKSNLSTTKHPNSQSRTGGMSNP